jgi:hypothetical protein
MNQLHLNMHLGIREKELCMWSVNAVNYIKLLTKTEHAHLIHSWTQSTAHTSGSLLNAVYSAHLVHS